MGMAGVNDDMKQECTRLNPCEEIFSLVCTRILP